MSSNIGITISQIEYALAVQKTGSFSAAAKSCNVSQPSLSEMIQKLEGTLEVILFDRRKSPVVSTEVGKAVLLQMKLALTECLRIQEVTQSWRKEIKGQLKVGLIPTLASSVVPLFLRGLRNKFPELRIEIQESTTDHLIEFLNHGDIDCAILSTPENAPGHLTEKVLFYEPFVVYASTDNRILKKSSLMATDLLDQEVLLMDETHCMRDQTLALCGLKKNAPKRQTTVQGSVATLLSVVDQEGSMTFIPELIAGALSKEIKKNQLREFEHAKFNRKVSLLFNKTYLKRRFIDLLFAEIQENIPAGVHLKKDRGNLILNPKLERFD